MTKAMICLLCKHLIGVNDNVQWYCKAYPNGIPMNIVSGNFSHKEPYLNDNGIIYEYTNKKMQLVGLDKIK